MTDVQTITVTACDLGEVLAYAERVRKARESGNIMEYPWPDWSAAKGVVREVYYPDGSVSMVSLDRETEKLSLTATGEEGSLAWQDRGRVASEVSAAMSKRGRACSVIEHDAAADADAATLHSFILTASSPDGPTGCEVGDASAALRRLVEKAKRP
jgi:hypothetical protein